METHRRRPAQRLTRQRFAAGLNAGLADNDQSQPSQDGCDYFGGSIVVNIENNPPLPLRSSPPRMSIIVLRFVVLLFVMVTLMALAWNN